MYEVCDIEFEDVMIEIQGVYCGRFTGSAGIDQDGAVCSLAVEGIKNGQRKWARLDVTPYKHSRNWDDNFAILLAHNVEQQMKDEIREALIDWQDHVNVREPEQVSP